ncbi:MAG: fluoride efflux transporter FluC, partial [Tabrizicola sp.]
MNGFLLVALGGAIGASLRHGVGLVAMRHLPTGWPWGTNFVNIAGSLAMGLLIGW